VEDACVQSRERAGTAAKDKPLGQTELKPFLRENRKKES
jgi:hypothetical protein